MKFENKVTSLFDACLDVSYGYTESATNDKVGPHFLRITDIQNGIVDWRTVPYCTIDQQKIDKYLLAEGDIVIARTGNSTGENYAYRGNEKAVFASYLIRYRIDTNRFNPFYIWYNLRSKKWFDFVEAVKGGSAQAGASAKLLGGYEIAEIDIESQNKIVNILQNIDDKIEKNNQINQTLEAIAQTLFKSWFVDFDPVKAKIAAKEQGQDPQQAAMMAISGKTAEQIAQLPEDKRTELAATADLFPDEMVECELGMIPKGWKVGKIGEIYQTTSGGTPSRDKKHFFENGTIDWVKSKELTNSFVHKTEEQITEEAILNSSAKLLPPNTILLAMYGATVGQFAILGMPAACNQAICAILPNKTYPYTFIYSWLKENKENVMGRASGSAQQNISQIIIKGIDIIVPHVALIGVFHTKVGKSFDLLLSNIKENQTLSNLRDELLPQLLAGNIILEDGGVI